MVRIEIGIGGESRAATGAINAVTKQLQTMQKTLQALGKSTADQSKIMARGFAGLAGTTQNLTAEIKTLGGVKKKELRFREQRTDAKQFALEMINLRDAGSAFVIMSQQLGQVLDEIRDDFVEWDALVQQTAVLTTKAGEEINLAIRGDIIRASNRMAREFALDTKQVVTGMREVVAMGFEFDEAAQIMRAAALTAVGGLGEIADTSQFLVNVMRAFGDELENINIIAATTTFVANETSLQITDMGIAMQFVASTAGSMGFELAETAATLGIMADAGLGASIAGTSLNRFLTQLARPAESARDALDRFGIAVEDEQGNFLGLVDIFRNVIEATKDMEKRDKIRLINAMFGIRGQRALNLVEAQRVEKLEELVNQLKKFNTDEEAMNFLVGISNGMLSTQAAAWARVNTQVEQSSRVMAEAAIPVQIQFRGLVATLLEVLANLPPGFRELAAGGLVVVQSLLGMSGQLFLLVTSAQTAGKSILTLTRLIKGGKTATAGLTAATEAHNAAEIKRSGTMSRSIFGLGRFNRRTEVAINKTKALTFAAGAAAAALGGIALSMSAVNSETREQSIAATALASLMWAMAGAMAAAAIANAGVFSAGIGSIAAAALITAAIGGVITWLASEQARASRAAQGLQEGAFFPGRPSRGTLFRAGEGVEGEVLAPETMLRRVFRDEIQKVLVQQNISRDQFNFEVLNFGEFGPLDALMIAETINDVQERRRFR